MQGAEESIDERRFGAVDHVLPIKIDHHFGELSNLAELFERNHLKHVDPIVLVIKVKRIGAYFYGELKKKSGWKYGLVFELELGQVSDWDGLASKISEGMRQAKREFVNPSPCIHTT